VFPVGTNAADTAEGRWLVRYGGEVASALDEFTTHLIAANPGTDKAMHAFHVP